MLINSKKMRDCLEDLCWLLLRLLEKSWLVNRKENKKIDKNDQDKNITTKNMILDNDLKPYENRRPTYIYFQVADSFHHASMSYPRTLVRISLRQNLYIPSLRPIIYKTKAYWVSVTLFIYFF